MTAWHWKLTYTTSKKIDVVYVAVHALQFQSLLSWHIAVQLLEIGYLLVETYAHDVNVAWNTMLSGTGDVERNQIAAEAILPPSIQVVANVVRNERIRSGRITGSHSTKNVVQFTVFQNVRIEIIIL